MAVTKVTAKSGNRKTGPITTTSRSQDSCPNACPFMGNGCYAEYGPGGGVFGLTRRYGTEEERAEVLTVADVAKADGLVRWNVSGDVMNADGETLDTDYLGWIREVAEARPDVSHILYTHGWRAGDADAFPFPVNASCETEAETEEASARGYLPVLTVGTEEDVPTDRNADGRNYVVCPAITREDVTCDTCRMCARGDTGTRPRPVVVFLAHGAGKRKATNAARAKTEGNAS